MWLDSSLFLILLLFLLHSVALVSARLGLERVGESDAENAHVDDKIIYNMSSLTLVPLGVASG